MMESCLAATGRRSHYQIRAWGLPGKRLGVMLSIHALKDKDHAVYFFGEAPVLSLDFTTRIPYITLLVKRAEGLYRVQERSVAWRRQRANPSALSRGRWLQSFVWCGPAGQTWPGCRPDAGRRRPTWWPESQLSVQRFRDGKDQQAVCCRGQTSKRFVDKHGRRGTIQALVGLRRTGASASRHRRINPRSRAALFPGAPGSLGYQLRPTARAVERAPATGPVGDRNAQLSSVGSGLTTNPLSAAQAASTASARTA